jgi:hypothetical protein
MSFRTLVLALLAPAAHAGWDSHCEASPLGGLVENCCYSTRTITGATGASFGQQRVFESKTLEAEAEALCEGAFALENLLKMRAFLDGDRQSTHAERADVMWDFKLWSELMATWTPEAPLDVTLEAVHAWREAQDATTFDDASPAAPVEVAFLRGAVSVAERDLAARAGGARVIVLEESDFLDEDAHGILFADVRSARAAAAFARCPSTDVFGDYAGVAPKVSIGLMQEAWDLERADLPWTPRREALAVDATCPWDRRALLGAAAAAGRGSLVDALLPRTPAPDLDAAAAAAVAGGAVDVARALVAAGADATLVSLLALGECRAAAKSALAPPPPPAACPEPEVAAVAAGRGILATLARVWLALVLVLVLAPGPDAWFPAPKLARVLLPALARDLVRVRDAAAGRGLFFFVYGPGRVVREYEATVRELRAANAALAADLADLREIQLFE